jgi:dTDP-4-amino-4,6-dideoxygalactose transaminase
VDTGSSFLPSDLLAAFLYAQLESLDDIQCKRKILWDLYFNLLSPLSEKKIIDLPNNPDYASNNAHMFYIVCKSLEERTKLISFLKQKGILSVFHYLNLQSSSFMKNKVLQKTLSHTDSYSDKLLRLPLYYELTFDQVKAISNYIKEFYSLPI